MLGSGRGGVRLNFKSQWQEAMLDWPEVILDWPEVGEAGVRVGVLGVTSAL